MRLHQSIIGIAACLPLLAAAQDRRQVTEPVVPPLCVALHADKTVGPDRVMAAADEAREDSGRIQTAIDHCPAGTTVALMAADGKNAFLSGPLELRDGIALQVGPGVTLYASRRAADYDEPRHPGVCGTVVDGNARRAGGCRPLISVNDAKNAAVIGPGVIDGRGDFPLLGQTSSWWQRARAAEPDNRHLYAVRLVVAKSADNFVLYKIGLHNSPNFHVTVNDTDGFTAWGVHLQSPTVAGTDARNTDGIDPGSSTNVTVAYSWLETDDDNIAIKTGVSYMSVLHNHFYTGHGMSIGSETFSGVSHLLVDDLTLDHTTSGIRIKSNVTRGGPVRDLTYQNICMRDVQVPIAISPYYMGQTIEKFVDPGLRGNRIPDYKGIHLRNISILTPGDVLIAGHDDAHRTEVSLDNVNMIGASDALMHLRMADIRQSAGNLPLDLAARGNAVKLGKDDKTAQPYACEGKFLPMR
jgi:polygalacturonase